MTKQREKTFRVAADIDSKMYRALEKTKKRTGLPISVLIRVAIRRSIPMMTKASWVDIVGAGN